MVVRRSRRRGTSATALAAASSLSLLLRGDPALAFSHRPRGPSFGVPPPSTRRARTAPASRPPRRIRPDGGEGRTAACFPLFASEAKFEKIDEDDDQIMAFMDSSGNGIDCYVDSYATVEGVEYTIGSPCDYTVALCYFEGGEQLVPIELDDPLMDDVFPIAEGIIEDEFGEELVLLRTPQTFTLVGELEESEEDDDDAFDDDDEEGGDALSDTEEEVEILVSFEEDGQEYHLVRLLDPVLLVGTAGNENTRVLLTPEESDMVMPKLENMFMNYQDEGDDDRTCKAGS
ncbi:hypothetical protein ACHAWF_013015 [Thalassiosira exigua]